MYIYLLILLPHAAIPVHFTTKFREHFKLLLATDQLNAQILVL